MPLPFLEIDFVTILSTAFWIWMLVDCLLNKRVKLFWLFFIFFTHLIGAVIYYCVACSHRNPAEALNYYVTYVGKFLRPKTAPPAQPPAAGPKSYSYAYPEYQQGYQAQQPEPAGGASVVQAGEVAAYSSQAEYEQPTATYPEMPLQQQ